MLIGQPVDSRVDVGKAVRNGEEVQVQVFSGSSALNPGSLTDQVEAISRVLSPLAASEVGSIRCIGLNVGVPPALPRPIGGLRPCPPFPRVTRLMDEPQCAVREPRQGSKHATA